MAVVYYQLFIIGTIIASYFGSDRLGRWLNRADLPPSSAAYLVAVGWSIFTITHVFALPLMIVQFISIWGTAAVLRHFGHKERKLEQMRRALSDLEPEAIDVIVELSQSQQLETVVGRRHLKELRRAVKEANTTLVILSGWANDYVIDHDFQRRLHAALTRGVRVYIGYGWTSPSRPSDLSASEKRAIDTLAALAADARRLGRGSLHFARWPNHAKMLICDDRYAICGSHNWLSNRGFSNDERSWVVMDSTFVRTERDDIIRRVEAAAKPKAAA